MKKTLVIFLVLVFSISLISCSDSAGAPKSVADITKILKDDGWETDPMSEAELRFSDTLTAKEGVSALKGEFVVNYMFFEKDDQIKQFFEKEFSGQEFGGQMEEVKSGIGEVHNKISMMGIEVHAIKKGLGLVIFFGVPEADVKTMANKLGL